MKKTLRLLIIFTLMSGINSNAQELKASYKFDGPYTNLNHGEFIQYREGHKVKVIDVTDSTVVFRYYKFKDADTLQNSIYYYKQHPDNEALGFTDDPVSEDLTDGKDVLVHTMSKDAFEKYTSRIYPWFKGVRAGIFTLPFKIRLNDFDFEPNANIGMNLGAQFRLNTNEENKWIIETTLGIGLSNVNLNPKNSDLEATDGEDANRSASAFSLSGGLMVHLSETINLGIQYGWDYLGNNDKDIRWKYDKKPWLGIGINIGFSVSETKETNPTNTP